ncbi:methyltransferase [Actinoplanes sp. NPDC026623]|uniref:methyltransferase n=1 Tax=Actinoplanes sp. NPDC026623 TaxID=3155610 RepID=UPI003404E692
MPENVDLEAMADLATPWCVRVAVTVRVAEQIAAGRAGVEQIAAVAGVNTDALTRVLRHLVGRGVFEEPSPGEFALNEAARGLMAPELRAGLDLDGIGGRLAGLWSGLLTSVRTGEPGYAEVFGRPFWEDLNAHPDIAAGFDALMGPEGHGAPRPDILVSDDWTGVTCVADVGGGTGTLLAAILRARPELRGILVDLPRTVARSADSFAEAGVTDRVTTFGQSFFDPLPAGAELYLLKSVISDWPDPAAREILRRCADAAGPSGRVVVIGGVSPGQPDGAGDLMMMVLAGGRERSLADFTGLAGEAGLEVLAAGRSPAGKYVVECRCTMPR